MEATAKLTFARLSPQKTRLVVDMVRGKGVQEALNILKFSPQKAAEIVSKLVRSAVANAEQKGVGDVDRLVVRSIYVDQGPVLRRFMPKGRGSASRIRKPTSHITVVLGEQ
jgi:large subunit ribosomal protein L22